VLADHALQQPLHIAQKIGQIQNFGLDQLAPAEGEQLISKSSGPAG